MTDDFAQLREKVKNDQNCENIKIEFVWQPISCFSWRRFQESLYNFI